jgi:glycosyltransferase involved in cell wall biosynthesis
MRNNLLIPSFNDSRSLKELLDIVCSSSLFHQIVIVDGGSSDCTERIVNSFKDERIIFCSSDTFSLKKSISPIAKSRNMAISLFEENSNIFFIDLGCKYDAASINNLVMAFNISDIDYAFGVTYPFNRNIYSFRYSNLMVKNSKSYSLKHLPSSRFLGIRYNIFKEIGGFKEKAFAGEDTDFAISLVNRFKGKVIDGHIHWIVPDNRYDAIKKHFYYGLGDGSYKNNISIILFCLFFFYVPTSFSDFSIYFYEKCLIRFSYGLGGFVGLIFKK